ncbi:hypothetical protein KUTeg_017814 [Tegillarca granosa]|uniref:Uncharacterized protein n=1 Tax=Tegillarca granosa TaxID=220873 RepID=A0ABQ9EII0_TEGGR|nr:hypothetical protein KUTeg_017814 [Tegillarca granosa]
MYRMRGKILQKYGMKFKVLHQVEVIFTFLHLNNIFWYFDDLNFEYFVKMQVKEADLSSNIFAPESFTTKDACWLDGSSFCFKCWNTSTHSRLFRKSSVTDASA